MSGRRVSPYLLARIPAVAAEPQWGGGLSRAELAAALHVRETDRVFAVSLLVCWRRGQVDFWRDYVIALTPGATERGPR